MAVKSKPSPEFTTTASGRVIELPVAEHGYPIAELHGEAAIHEAANHIRAGDLSEALIWIERIDPSLVGLVTLVQRGA